MNYYIMLEMTRSGYSFEEWVGLTKETLNLKHYLKKHKKDYIQNIEYTIFKFSVKKRDALI